MKLNTVDIFAGCGGLSLGLHRAGHRLLFAIEKDPMAFESFEANFLKKDASFAVADIWPDWLSKTNHDIHDLLTDDTFREQLSRLSGTIDLLCGGPPCQGFSVGGIRDGQDSRNQLPRRYLEFMDLVNPRFVLLENVEGMTRRFKSKPTEHNSSYADWLASEFSTRGYDVHYEVLNAAEFGIPQLRNRLFIFGVRQDQSSSIRASDFFRLLLGNARHFRKQRSLPLRKPVTVYDAISDIDNDELIICPDSPRFKSGVYGTPRSAFAKLMRKGMNGERTPNSHRFSHHLPHTLDFYKKVQELGMFGRLPKQFLREHGTKKDKKVLIDPEKPASTITTHPDEFIHFRVPRNISVREMARLQSFPDQFVFRGRYTINGERRRLDVARCSQVGNAVPPLLAEAIGEALSEFAVLLSESKSLPNDIAAITLNKKTAILSLR